MNRKVFGIIGLVSMLLLGASCGPQQPAVTATAVQTRLWALPASELKALAAEDETIASQQVEAWNSHDLDAIRNVYTQDIVHYDGYPRFVGLAEVMDMAKLFLASSPQFTGELGKTYVRSYNKQREEWVSIWKYWNTMEYTQEHPLVEYDLLTARDGRISYWRLFYVPEYLSKNLGVTVNTKLLEDYAVAWSSGDPQQVADFYSLAAVHHDSIMGFYAEGRDNIRKYAEQYFSWFPNTKLELLQSIGERLPNQVGRDVKITQGGTYAIHTLKDNGGPCDVNMLVLLETADAGVLTEHDYYDVDSLIACGWIRDY